MVDFVTKISGYKCNFGLIMCSLLYCCHLIVFIIFFLTLFSFKYDICFSRTKVQKESDSMVYKIKGFQTDHRDNISKV